MLFRIIQTAGLLHQETRLTGLCRGEKLAWVSLLTSGTIRQLILKQMGHPVRRIYTDVDCLRWSMDIARALVYLHSGIAGSMILHRDINPDNIMLTSRDPHKAAAKLVDFGLHTSIAKTEECSPDGMPISPPPPPAFTSACPCFFAMHLELCRIPRCTAVSCCFLNQATFNNLRQSCVVIGPCAQMHQQACKPCPQVNSKMVAP